MRTSNLGPLIAILSSSVLSFVAGQYLPYAIQQPPGVIAAVPLTIFAVSTVVALISAAYLVKSIIANSKKEAGLGGKEPTKELAEEPVYKENTNLGNKPIREEVGQQYIASQKQTEKSVCKNPENKPSMPIPTPPPVTFGTQPDPSASAAPPLPPLPPLPLSKNATFPPPPPLPPLPQGATLPLAGNDRASLLQSIRNAGGKPMKQRSGKASAKEQSSNNGSGQQADYMDDLKAKLAQRRKGVTGEQTSNVQQSHGQKPEEILNKISNLIPEPQPRSRSNSVSSSSSEELERDWSDNEYSTPPTYQPNNKKRSESPDSAHGSDNEGQNADQETGAQVPSDSQSGHRERSWSLDSGNASGDGVTTPPLYPAPKTEKPLAPPKPTGLRTRLKTSPAAQVNNAVPVNSEVQDPSTLSVKECAEKYKGGFPVFPS